MQRRVGALAAACAAVATLSAAPIAAARTKTVYADVPAAAQKVLNKYSASANEFFLSRVTIHTGDSVKFITNGAHTIDLPGPSNRDLPLTTSGGAISGDNDAAGNPFWFNGQRPHLTLNLGLVVPQISPTYDGTKRILDALSLGPNPPKPMLVKFTKPGTYKYFCDIHYGMVGYVVVKPASKPIPSAHQDAVALAAQIKQAEDAAKRLAHTAPAKHNQVQLGAADPSGVEDYGMFPSRLVVTKGTTVTFSMSKSTRDVHTASFGPSPYLTMLANSLTSPSPLEEAWYPSDDPAHGSPVVTATAHGNGFGSTGALDRDPSTVAVPPSGKLKFTQPGVYHYICMIHSFMHGTVVVRS